MVDGELVILMNTRDKSLRLTDLRDGKEYDYARGNPSTSVYSISGTEMLLVQQTGPKGVGIDKLCIPKRDVRIEYVVLED
tara:strand:+ start:316 stop:555 length:240 start_codon:yes stop_codon:yes gene_type:complete